MRKKAEKKIRDAASRLEAAERYRLDRVRVLADLHPKVFDKTILDMERVGSIELFTDGMEGMSPAETRLLVRRGDVFYVSFRFLDHPAPPVLRPENFSPRNTPATVETVVVVLENLLPGEWDAFERSCEAEGRTVFGKIEEMIRRYLYQGPSSG